MDALTNKEEAPAVRDPLAPPATVRRTESPPQQCSQTQILSPPHLPMCKNYKTGHGKGTHTGLGISLVPVVPSQADVPLM